MPVSKKARACALPVSDFVEKIHKLNAGGMTPKRAQALLDDQRTRLTSELGEQKFRALREAAAHVHQVVQDSLEAVARSGFITQDTLDVLSEAKHYSPYAILDFTSSEKVSGLPKPRKGTTRDPDRMLEAAEHKVRSALAAVHVNDQKKRLIKWLADEGEQVAKVRAEWQKARADVGGREVPGGWAMVGQDAKDHEGMAVISLWDGGVQQFYAIDPGIAATFTRTMPSVSRILETPLFVHRSLFLTLNPLWHGSNAARDAFVAGTQNPDYRPIIDLPKFIIDYFGALPTAMQARRKTADLVARAEGRTIAGGEVSQLEAHRAGEFLEFQKSGAAPSFYRADVIHGEHGERRGDRFSVQDYLNDTIAGQTKERGRAVRIVSGYNDFWLDVMQVMEALPRVAAWQRAMKDYNGAIPDDVLRRIRVRLGSPPFSRTWRGTNPTFSRLFQFTLANFNGISASIEALRQPGGASTLVKSGLILAPHSMMMAMRMGVFGGDDEDDALYPWVASLKEMSLWQLAATLPLPLFIEDTERGRRGRFFMLPLDHFRMPFAASIVHLWDRLNSDDPPGEATIKAMHDSLMSFMDAVTPTPTATLDWLRDTGVLFRGGNPRDEFRERDWFTETEMQAYGPGKKALKWFFVATPEMFGMPWIANNAVRLMDPAMARPDRLPPDSIVRPLHNVPYLGAGTRRFLNIIPYGEEERMARAGERFQRERAGERIEDRPGYQRYARSWAERNENPTPRQVAEAAREHAVKQLPRLRAGKTRDASTVANSIARGTAKAIVTSYPRYAYLRQILAANDSGLATAKLRELIRMRTRPVRQIRDDLKFAQDAGALSRGMGSRLNPLLQ